MNTTDESRPLVSIIVRTKDRPKLLRKALASIAAQTYRPIEVVLVNDGGCEPDIEEVRALLGDVRLNYIGLETNRGRARAGNVGIENAKGTYVGFLDDDDELYPDHVAALVPLLERLDYEIAYSDSAMIYKEYDPSSGAVKDKEETVVFSRDFDYASLLLENYIPFMCLLFRREVLEEVGGIDESLELYEDWDLLIRLADKHPFVHVKKTTARYNQWAGEMQIAQRNKDSGFLRNSYLAVLSKHAEKITQDRLHRFVAGQAYDRLLSEEKAKTLRTLLNDIESRADALQADLRDKDAQIVALRSDLAGSDARVGALQSDLQERDSMIGGLKDSLVRRDEYVASLEDRLREREAYIGLIHAGLGWKLLRKYFALRDRLLPEGTKRRLFVRLLLRTAANPREVFSRLNKSDIRKFFRQVKESDPAYLEKKIGQKLSSPAADREAPGESPMRESGDYFTFLCSMNAKEGADYVPCAVPDLPETDIRLIAFYLPQFHPIPENDEWWGKGFTEWTNVSKALPQFIGHYQPRCPGELGFYDLRVPEVQKRQIELARQYGIYGFCFHFYWFNGRTLLERPLRNFADNFDFPFCINWANENWTRRWDGLENEILLSQNHSPDDDMKFIQYVSAYLKHRNYIRVGSRPLLIVYRPSLFPDPKATGERWRAWCRANGIGEIYLAAVRTLFDQVDPENIGFDALIEFPPHELPFKETSRSFTMINPHFDGVISEYQDAADYYMTCATPSFKQFRGIVPGWDNEARRTGKGKVLVGSTPELFKKWLTALCHFTHSNFTPGERMIFVNAWNEWAEGAYLEPDWRYGYAYLQAVADALIEYEAEGRRRKVAYVCHDAHFHGAQLLSLSIVRTLRTQFNYDVHFLLKSGGELEPEFSRYATVYNLERDFCRPGEREALVARLSDAGIREAICNSVASGDLTELFRKKGIRTVTLVHELPNIIKEKGLERNARVLAESSEKVVFPAEFVREKFRTVVPLGDEKTVIQPQGLYKTNRYRARKDEARKELRARLSLPGKARIVLGVGFADHRKGIDLFLKAAESVAQKREDVYFLWVGNLHLDLEAKIAEAANRCRQIILQKASADTALFYAGADLYLLTSREDPFPAVVLEAMDAGLPVVGFDNAGGFRDIVTEDTGMLVPYEDLEAMAGAVLRLLDDPQKMRAMEHSTAKLIEERFRFGDYVYALLGLLGHEYKKVSVIVPNYNYARYLTLRMDSILKQTYPVYEIIILDDASTDGSPAVACKYLEGRENIKLIRNETNSGSVFRQWAKGLQAATGDYIWIAEADDLCEDNFLEELMSCFGEDPDIVMAYCQSRQIDDRGTVLADNYLEYTNDIDKDKWRSDYIRVGVREIEDTLAVKNTVPNVSAVVFRKRDISPILDELVNFRVAGDWFFYVWLLRQGKIGYRSQPLNLHRRHDKGVTKSEDRELHYREVSDMQDYVMRDFNVGEETKRKVRSYRDHLIGYLDLRADVRQV